MIGSPFDHRMIWSFVGQPFGSILPPWIVCLWSSSTGFGERVWPGKTFHFFSNASFSICSFITSLVLSKARPSYPFHSMIPLFIHPVSPLVEPSLNLLFHSYALEYISGKCATALPSVNRGSICPYLPNISERRICRDFRQWSDVYRAVRPWIRVLPNAPSAELI